MTILLRQSKTGLYLASSGCWTTERSEAQRFKSVKEALALLPALAGPVEVHYDPRDETMEYTVPLGFEPVSKRPPSARGPKAPGDQQYQVMACFFFGYRYFRYSEYQCLYR